MGSVSRGLGHHSTGFPRASMDLRHDCVSRPVDQNSSRFFNNCRHFWADCVSRNLPHDSSARIRPARPARRRPVGPNKPFPQPIFPIPPRVPLVPRDAGPPMPLSLAFRTTAHPLPRTDSRPGLEPAPTDRARTTATLPALARHGPHRPAVQPTSVRTLSYRAVRKPDDAERHGQAGGSLLTSRGGSFSVSGEGQSPQER